MPLDKYCSGTYGAVQAEDTTQLIVFSFPQSALLLTPHSAWQKPNKKVYRKKTKKSNQPLSIQLLRISLLTIETFIHT